MAGNQESIASYILKEKWRSRKNLDTLAKDHPALVKKLGQVLKLPLSAGFDIAQSWEELQREICWNSTGSKLAVGGKRQLTLVEFKSLIRDSGFDLVGQFPLIISDLSVKRIWDIKFMSSDERIVVAGALKARKDLPAGFVLVFNVGAANNGSGMLEPELCYTTQCIMHAVCPLPDKPDSFLVAGDDGAIRVFHLNRSSQSGHIQGGASKFDYYATCLEVHPLDSNLILASQRNGIVYVFDRRCLHDIGQVDQGAPLVAPDELNGENALISYNVGSYIRWAEFNPDGSEVLITCTNERVLLAKFDHRRCTESSSTSYKMGDQTKYFEFSVCKAAFWGEEHIITASADGKWKLWNKTSGELVTSNSDDSVALCLAPNPVFVCLAVMFKNTLALYSTASECDQEQQVAGKTEDQPLA